MGEESRQASEAKPGLDRGAGLKGAEGPGGGEGLLRLEVLTNRGRREPVGEAEPQA